VIQHVTKAVWTSSRDRLASVDSSTSMVQITEDYAAHFYYMYINKHEEKHLTGDQIRILLFTLPFVLRDLIAPEVNRLYAMLHNMLHNIHNILHNMLHNILHKLLQNMFWVRSPNQCQDSCS
jgi:hypothetical protein